MHHQSKDLLALNLCQYHNMPVCKELDVPGLSLTTRNRDNPMARQNDSPTLKTCDSL